MKINDIAKLTIVELSKRNLLLTPENYSDVFDELSQKHGLISPNANKIDNFLKKLNPTLQKELQGKRVKTLEELLTFAIAKSNFYDNQYQDKSKNDNSQNKLNQINLLLQKSLLRAISGFKHKKYNELVSQSLEKLNVPNIGNIEEIKNLWMDFLGKNSDIFEKFKVFGVDTKADLDDIINEIIAKIEQKNSFYSCLAPVFAYSLTPSIARKITEDMEALCDDLKSTPELLTTSDITTRIKDAIAKRIELDQQEISNNNTFLYQILDNINQNIERILASSNETCTKVELIRQQVEKIPPNPDFDPIKNKFLGLIGAFESEVKVLQSQTQSNIDNINELQNKVVCLQNEVKRLKEENTQDFLTKILNKKAIEKKLTEFEEQYKSKKEDYCVCVMDIDYFKTINDTYGHNAGDLILASIGEIFKEEIKPPHFAGRFGGEEFVVVFKTDKINASKMIEEIRGQIKNYDFIYKNDRINITISGGLTQRSLIANNLNIIDVADKLLYKAKNSGRDRLIVS